VIGSILGFAGIIVGSLTGILGVWFGRKKMAADAESTQVDTAININDALQKQLGALEVTTTTLRQEVAALERRERIRDRHDLWHQAWDYDTMRACREAGISVADPPPLGSDGADPGGARTRAEDYGLPGTERAEGDRRG
jgi:hypothetical protein